jgi:4-hydroxybenzoate polyprenyltransferase
MSTQTTTAKVANGQHGSVNPLHKQYGGIHTGKWVDCLPSSWIPYIQLARLSPPAPVLLIYFPHLFGLIYGAIVTQASVQDTLSMAGLLLGGSLFFSNAAHGWDDFVDEPIDKLIVRTQKRPIVRGAISSRAALIFTIIQAIMTAGFLIPLPPRTALYALGTAIATTYYPFAKRHINAPQAVLGYCLANGIAVGAAAMGADPMANYAVPCLVGASAIWSVIYDTVYASIDMKDDIRLGIGSTAVLFGSQMKFWMYVLLGIFVGLLGAAGQISGFGLAYSLISMLGGGLTMAVMIANVELQNGLSCWWWFTYSFWFVGGSITLGLLTEYIPLIL